jgi:hypothetical protein
MENWYLLAGLGAVVVGVLFQRLVTRRQLPLPPGPPGHWLWGNVAEMNEPHRAVKSATEYREMYGVCLVVFAPSTTLIQIGWWHQGDLVCLQTMSNTSILINDESLVIELLDKRASETADRARNVFVREL